MAYFGASGVEFDFQKGAERPERNRAKNCDAEHPRTGTNVEFHLRMLCGNMSLQIVLPGETSFSAAKSVPTFSVMTVETATIVLGLMSDEVFLQ